MQHRSHLVHVTNNDTRLPLTTTLVLPSITPHPASEGNVIPQKECHPNGFIPQSDMDARRQVSLCTIAPDVTKRRASLPPNAPRARASTAHASNLPSCTQGGWVINGCHPIPTNTRKSWREVRTPE